MKKLIFVVPFLCSVILAQSPPNPESRVAGRFVAYNYGVWSLPVYSFPSGTGSKTFTLTNPTVRLPDGRMIMPFSTTAPIYVGTEVVTPTAVGSGCVANSPIIGGCSITATFTFAHTNADPVRSGTFGLQEALNDAGTSGGGVVTVDSAWANAGGTTGIINAATLPSNTGIEDARAGLPSPSGGPYLPLAGGPMSGTAGTGTPVGSVTMTALGVGGNIPDPTADWGFPVLGVFDNENDSASEAAAVPVIPLGVYLNWAPTSAIADNQQANVIQQFMDVNLDGQATATVGLMAANFNVNNQGTTTPASVVQGIRVGATNTAPSTSLVGIGSSVDQETTGTAPDTDGVVSRIDVHAAGTLENLISYRAELFASAGALGNYQGFNFDTTDALWSMTSIANVVAFEVGNIDVTGKSTTTACAFCAGSVTGATNNWGIDITGTEPNFLGGPLQAATLKPATARKGTFTCTAAGTITISNANEAATSDVIISLNTAGGTISTPPAMKTVTASTGFTVLCGAADTSVYNYDILN